MLNTVKNSVFFNSVKNTDFLNFQFLTLGFFCYCVFTYFCMFLNLIEEDIIYHAEFLVLVLN